MIIGDGDRIVFTGDSVTDAGRGRPIGEGLHAGVGSGYVRQIENLLNVLYPERRFFITNTGCSGDTSRELKARWQNDVMNLKPDWVSVMIGVNDVWHELEFQNGVELERFERIYRMLLQDTLAKLPSLKIVLCVEKEDISVCKGEAFSIHFVIHFAA